VRRSFRLAATRQYQDTEGVIRQPHWGKPAGQTLCGILHSTGLFGEGVEDRDSGQFEVLDVAGDYGHTVHPRRCGDERVDYRERLRVLLTAPGCGDREGDREHPVFEPDLHIPEPAFEGGGLVLVSRPRTLAIPCGERDDAQVVSQGPAARGDGPRR
jgi:hypothetical protein